MSTNMSPDLKPVALIAGPTASGKSDLAVQLAQRLGRDGRRGVVINADSQQVYRDLHILSARPTEEEMGGIEHRLFGAWDGAEACSAAEWAEAAEREIADVHATGGVPILCGGTGLYIRTLLDGIAPVPEIDPEIRHAVRALDQAEARAALESEDPAAAKRLAPADASRTTRALEVVRSTGKTLAEWQTLKSGGIARETTLAPLVVLPEREWLFARCDLRFERMMDTGAIEEVEAIEARGLDPSLPVMRAIGVPEIRGFIQGNLSRAQAIAAGQTATRQYAKRQYTWFRNQPPEAWPRADNKTIVECDYFVSLFHSGG
ncbi:tRNA (adenosine(37)-N6)-dimethylallyltransferase MiaA [Erythrobacter sp.]|uniref:tRNA (adenosine(37)-N6)-dimethylallyltransferase MiaA n=1 Tax=Erythrobacter sp. TaxID=1042 RepID=UPI001B0B6DDB|nr:tRNA (adenosine(37)-N6)-dimethylallyltransferase MiaA [Erythrobacter sp.]MBO6526795.1 tRNA (adenosine(37)-N6)-dimethylallyltransferase MiaA [Erythrobacter sp.]MBO6528468.1 tRNA (adenosine(37)-N6)-dimethylallyltransferase MiaA [Erythrobacter sp.]